MARDKNWVKGQDIQTSDDLRTLRTKVMRYFDIDYGRATNILRSLGYATEETAESQDGTAEELVKLDHDPSKSGITSQYDRTVPSTIEEQKNAIQRIVDFAKKVKDKMSRAVIGGITDRQKTDFAKIGFSDIDNSWVHSIENSAVNHNKNHHGNEKVEDNRGQIAITDEDYQRIPDILENYDSITKSDNKTKGTQNDVIIYQKEFDDGYIYYLEEKRDNRKSLAFHTMYKKKKGTDSSDGFVANATPITPKATSDNLSSEGKGNTKTSESQDTRGEKSKPDFADSNEAYAYKKAITKQTQNRYYRQAKADSTPEVLSQKSDEWLDQRIAKLEKYEDDTDDGEIFLQHNYDDDNIPTKAEIEERVNRAAEAAAYLPKLRAEKARRHNETLFEKAKRIAKQVILPKKAKTVNLHNYHTKDKDSRGLNGIYYKDGKAYASDAKILVERDESYPSEFEDTIRDKDKSEIKSKFPDIIRVFANVDKGVHADVDIESMRRNIARALEAQKAFGKAHDVAVEVGTGRQTGYFEPTNLKKFLDLIDTAEGTPNVTIVNTGSAIMLSLKSKGQRAVLMGLSDYGMKIGEQCYVVRDEIVWKPSGRDTDIDRINERLQNQNLKPSERAALEYEREIADNPVFTRRPRPAAQNIDEARSDFGQDHDRSSSSSDRERLLEDYDEFVGKWGKPEDVQKSEDETATLLNEFVKRHNENNGYIDEAKAAVAKMNTSELEEALNSLSDVPDSVEDWLSTSGADLIKASGAHKLAGRFNNLPEWRISETLNDIATKQACREALAAKNDGSMSKADKYIDGMKPIDRQRVSKVLNTKRSYNGVTMTQGEFVEKSVGDGKKFSYTVDDKGKKAYRVQAGDNAYFPISKTEYDYAQHLGGDMMSEQDGKLEETHARYRKLMSDYHNPDLAEINRQIVRLSKWADRKEVQQRLADYKEMKELYTQNLEWMKSNRPTEYEAIVNKNVEPHDDDRPVFRKATKAEPEAPSLVGVHNITIDKLLKALKLGGLANPSAAVIDLNKGGHDSYGDISLVMPSALVDKRTGRNAGTWAADAYTPRFPNTHKAWSDKSYRQFGKDMAGLPDGMGRRMWSAMQEYIENQNSPRGLSYLFLYERGEAPETVTRGSKYSEEIVNAVKKLGDINHSAYEMTEDELNELAQIYVDYKYGADKKEMYDDKITVFDALKEMDPELDTVKGIGLGKLNNFHYDVLRSARNVGEVDEHATENKAWNIVSEKGLDDKFYEWLQDKEDQYGVGEYLFGGYTPSGNRRDIPLTLENVSKLMKKEGRAGAESFFIESSGGVRAQITKRLNTLDAMRKNKDRLVSHDAFEKVKQEINDKYSELSRIVGSSYSRMAEVLTAKNMREAVKQYNKFVTDEEIEQLREFKDFLANAPTEYFETKFERPVDLKEFAAVVLPNDAPLEIRGAMYRAGLKIVEYERGNEADRRRALNEATADDGIKFRMAHDKNDFAEMQERAEKERGLVMPDLNEKSVNIVNVPRHDFAGTGKQALKAAEKWGKENLVGNHTATDSSGNSYEYAITNEAVEKYVSHSATQSSNSIGVHLAALKKLPDIIAESIEAEVHPSYTKDENGNRNAENRVNRNELIHRLYGAVNIDGTVYRVKTTMIESVVSSISKKPHSYEVTKVEVLPDKSDSTSNGALRETSTDVTIGMAKLLKGVEKSYDKGVKLLDASKNSTNRYRFIGEKGASRLDSREEATTRIDNLNIAREMETAGKGAKAIKMATGWERGADGKWRYETADFKKVDRTGNLHPERRQLSEDERKELADAFDELNDAFGDGVMELDRRGVEITDDTDMADIYIAGGMDATKAKRLAALEEKEKSVESTPKMLDDYIDDDELFAAYPELRNVKVEENPNDAFYGRLGSYNPETNTLTWNDGNDKTMVHEVQHIIQRQENFGTGGNVQSIVEARRLNGKLTRRVNQLLDDLGMDKWMQKLTDEEASNFLKSGYDKYKHFALGYEFAKAPGNEGFRDALISKLDEASAIIDENVRRTGDYSMQSPEDIYRSYMGEVESRNVESRMNMTDEERRSSLASDTEDVAREDQILIKNLLKGEAEMGSRVPKRMREIKDALKEADLNENQRAVVDAFSGDKDNTRLTVEREDGKHTVIMRQGSEGGAGTKHSIYRHYGTGVGVISAEDLKLIPEVLTNGERVEKERRGANLYEYTLVKDGVRYTVVTERKKGVEEFNDFYTNKKVQSSGTSRRAQSDTNTPEGAHTDKELDFDGTKVQNNSEKTADISVKAPSDRETSHEAMEKVVNDFAGNSGVKIRAVKDVTELDAFKRADKETQEDMLKAKGWYDPKTGEVYIVTGNHADVEDIKETIRHEVIGHMSLRELVG